MYLCVASEIQRSIHVGLLCVQHHAEDWPTMLSVVLMLISDGVLPPPKQPAFFTEESNGLLNSVSSLDNEYMITLLYPRYMVGCTKGRRVDCVLRVCFGNYVLFGVTFVNIHNCWWFSYFPMVTFVFIYYFEACYCTPHYCTLHYHHLFPSQHRFMINLFSQVIQITQKTWQMEIFT